MGPVRGLLHHHPGHCPSKSQNAHARVLILPKQISRLSKSFLNRNLAAGIGHTLVRTPKSMVRLINEASSAQDLPANSVAGAQEQNEDKHDDLE